MSEAVTITVRIEAETERAYMVSSGKNNGVWVPKSQILSIVQTTDGRHVMDIPEWLADEKGF